jgi:hypothetical protein
MNNKFVGIYENDGENYVLIAMYGYYPQRDKRDEFYDLKLSMMTMLDIEDMQMVNGLDKYAIMVYGSSGEPLRVYTAFPVEQLNGEYGPFTLSHYHQHLLGKVYDPMDYLFSD